MHAPVAFRYAVISLFSGALVAILHEVRAADDAIRPTHADLVYAKVNDLELRLDLYLPKVAAPRASDATEDARAAPGPLLVWIHGGAWRAGSKSTMPLGFLVARGYAAASVDYRLSPVARFPAQVHDIKAAIRFLRRRASEFGYDARRIGILGSSAGGHLAALVGVTNGHAELEGEIGDDLEISSDVQAIVDLYGPTNFHTILAQSTPHGLSVRVPAFKLLLGGLPEDHPDLARLASPVEHVGRGDPPLLILHGDQDPQVPINQSHELDGAYQSAKLDVCFEVVHGAGHGGAAFFDAQRQARIARFLERTIRGREAAIE